MAEGLFRKLADSSYEAHSAGTRPSQLNPLAVRAMTEIGIDISKQRSKDVAEYAGGAFDLVITVCDNARQSCPVFPGAVRRLHWPFPDPADATGSEDERMKVFRQVRKMIEARVRRFLTDGN
jgi:arsenate reductase (thioredoxin)